MESVRTSSRLMARGVTMTARKVPLQLPKPRSSQRVLQTRDAPAQLSLFPISRAPAR
jgi:hypothetical protein